MQVPRPGRLEELRRQHRARGISGKIFTRQLIGPACLSSDRLARSALCPFRTQLETAAPCAGFSGKIFTRQLIAPA